MIDWLDVRKDFEWKMKAVIDGTSHEDMGNQCSSKQAAKDGSCQHVYPQSDKEKHSSVDFSCFPPCLFSPVGKRWYQK